MHTFLKSHVIKSILILLFNFSTSYIISQEIPDFVTIKKLGNILESNNVKGSILVYDFIGNKLFSNDFDWAGKGFLPASTFKIPNSIIALETGVVNIDTTIFRWDNKARRLKVWEKDMNLKQAFQLSCVPCYQKVARKIGVKRMKAFLKKLDYRGMKVRKKNIDRFWLEGRSKISQYQQVDFLKRLYFGELPVSNKTRNAIKNIMLLEENPEYRLYAKTGWAIRNGNNTGWFVGFIESNNKVYFFATNIQPEEKFNMDMFSLIRKNVSMEAFKTLQIIN